MALFSPNTSIPNRFLFRFALPCREVEELSGRQTLPEECVLPDLGALDRPTVSRHGTRFEARSAWSNEGLAFQFSVRGKRKSLWCNPNRPDESDRLELWLDTRNVRNVHRATRFCHHFVCIPTGWGTDNGTEAMVFSLPINRAKQQPNDPPKGSIRIHTEMNGNDYQMFVFFTAAALTGYDPKEFREIGIAWELCDRDLGVQTLTAGTPFPYMENPTLWQTLKLETP